MTIPDRPVDGAEIATDWGQEIHDRVFAAKGTLCSGGAVTVADNTYVVSPIETPDEDPGGWLDTGGARLIVPTGAEGVYSCAAEFQTDDLDEASEMRCYVIVNGTGRLRATEGGDGSTTMQINPSGHLVLAAGDIITCASKKIGTAGPSVSVSLVSISLIRMTGEYGA